MQKRFTILIAFMLIGLFLLSPTLAWAQDGGDGETRYVVQPGDNLFRIAEQYGTSVQAIAIANNITNPNLIVIGQELIIPVDETPVDTGDDDAVTGDDDDGDILPTAVPVATEEAGDDDDAVTGDDDDSGDETPIVLTVYTVQRGDNLYRIAVDFGTTVRALVEENNLSNPNIIHVGLRLRIPLDALNPHGIGIDAGVDVDPENMFDDDDTGGDDTALPTAEPVDTSTGDPTEIPADTGTGGDDTGPTEVPADTGDDAVPTEEPSDTTPVETVTPVPTPEPTSAPPVSMPASSVAFDYGIEVNLLLVEDKQVVIDRAKELGMKWIKQEVDWALLQPSAEQSADPAMIGSLDQIVQLAEGNDLNLMLTINNAPTWARDNQADIGPATDNANFVAFVDFIARRYIGLVDAYEIWSEPNIATHWQGKPLSGASYAELLRVGYASIKGVDPEALIVSAGLASTGLNDGVNAIDDRTFLRQMYQAGVAGFTDAIGAHPFSAANAPDVTCCGNNPEISGWNDHPSFFFLDNLRDYRNIMNEFGDSGKFIWATQFGWGADEGSGNTPDEGLRFVTFIGMQTQADYTVQAFQQGRELGYVGPMFAWNLNFCQIDGGRGTSCFWSFLNPAGDPRTVYFSVRDMAK